MKPLVTNKKVLVFLCVCPPDKSMSVGSRAICIISSLIIFILNASVVEVHFSYFLTFVSINLADSLYALMYGIAFCAPVYGMISTLFVRKQFGGIFKKLSAIYRASKCCNSFLQQLFTIHYFDTFRFNLDEKHASFRFLAQANLLSEWMWTYFFLMMIGSAIITVVMTLVSIVMCRLINGNIEVEQLYHVYLVMLVGFTFDPIHKKALCLNIFTISSLVYRGTKHRTSDMLAKSHLPLPLHKHSFSWVALLYYCFYRCVSIIWHFIRCSNMQSINGTNPRKLATMSSFLTIEFVFTMLLRSE